MDTKSLAQPEARVMSLVSVVSVTVQNILMKARAHFQSKQQIMRATKVDDNAQKKTKK